MDPAIFAVGELVLNYPYLCQEIKHSKTVTDEKVRSFSTRKDTTKHKKIPVSWAGKTKMVQIGLESLTSCKYPHVRADCGAKNALCGLEENRRYGYPQKKSQRQNFIG